MKEFTTELTAQDNGFTTTVRDCDNNIVFRAPFKNGLEFGITAYYAERAERNGWKDYDISVVGAEEFIRAHFGQRQCANKITVTIKYEESNNE